MPRYPALLAGATLLLATPLAAQSGRSSSLTSVMLTATRLPSVSVALPTGAAAGLAGTLAADGSDFAPVPVTTSWNVDPATPVALTLVAFFEARDGAPASGNGEVTSGDGTMGTFELPGRAPTGGPKSFTPFSQVAVGPIGDVDGSLTLFTQPISVANARAGRTDDLQVRIDLTGRTDLPPGTPTGALTLVAITQ